MTCDVFSEFQKRGFDFACCKEYAFELGERHVRKLGSKACVARSKHQGPAATFLCEREETLACLVNWGQSTMSGVYEERFVTSRSAKTSLTCRKKIT